jgi:hypothetical protein
MFNRLVRIFPFLLLIFLFSCNRKDKRAALINEVEKMYLDYQVQAQEGDDKLTVLIRFRDGEEGDALLLPPDAEILLDELSLQADSTKRTGGFYEVHLPIDSFQGMHHLLLKQGGKLIHDQPFSFSKMGLAEEPGDSLSRGELVFRFTGLEKEDYVRVIATDTVFYSEGINRLDTVRNSQLLINRNDLALLENGPVQLVFSREWEQPLDGSGKPQGRISINYTLRREFLLKD